MSGSVNKDETKAFRTCDVLSTITGRLVSENGIGGVYEVLNWMSGESVFTHQLPRIGREAAAVMLAARPDLAAACDEVENVTRENWREWLSTWEARYGATIDVPKFAAAEHERIDPISELAELAHPDRIMVVGIDGSDPT